MCVISNVALSIGIAVYSPRLAPPLEHFVPPLALAISRNADAVAALQFFVDVSGAGWAGAVGPRGPGLWWWAVGVGMACASPVA